MCLCFTLNMEKAKATFFNSFVQEQFRGLLEEILVAVRFHLTRNSRHIPHSQVNTPCPKPQIAGAVGVYAEGAGYQRHELARLP